MEAITWYVFMVTTGVRTRFRNTNEIKYNKRGKGSRSYIVTLCTWYYLHFSVSRLLEVDITSMPWGEKKKKGLLFVG